MLQQQDLSAGPSRGGRPLLESGSSNAHFKTAAGMAAAAMRGHPPLLGAAGLALPGRLELLDRRLLGSFLPLLPPRLGAPHPLGGFGPRALSLGVSLRGGVAEGEGVLIWSMPNTAEKPPTGMLMMRACLAWCKLQAGKAQRSAAPVPGPHTIFSSFWRCSSALRFSARLASSYSRCNSVMAASLQAQGRAMCCAIKKSRAWVWSPGLNEPAAGQLSS